MFARLTIFILAMVVIAGTLLTLRQRNVEITGEIAMLHRQIDQARHGTWEQQARIAGALQPVTLRGAIAEAHLELEPITPPLASPPSALARAGESGY